MRKISVFLIVSLLLSGCSNNNKDKTNETTDFENEIINLKEEINNTKDITDDQLRESINISLKFIDAMNNSNFEYLERNINPEIKIDREKKVFLDKNNSESKFLKADYSKLEYRGHHLNNDKIIMLFGQANSEENIELEIIIKEENNNYIIDSYRN